MDLHRHGYNNKHMVKVMERVWLGFKKKKKAMLTGNEHQSPVLKSDVLLTYLSTRASCLHGLNKKIT